MPLVSVIIPTYGAPVFLDAAIRSVLTQTHHNLELIIVDDNNPDTDARRLTQNVINSYDDSRLIYIQHPFNKNVSAARNTGLAHAKGEYIAFLDSDDEYLPTRIEQCLKAISCSSDDIGGVYTGCEFRRGGKVYNKYKGVKDGRFLVQTLACTFMICSGSNIFLKSETINFFGGFDENFTRHEDYVFLAKMFSKYSLKAIQEILLIKNNENFNLPSIEKQIEIKEQYFNEFKCVIDSLSSAERAYIYHCNYVAIAENALRQHNRTIAKLYYFKAMKHKPLSIKELLRLLAFFCICLFKQKA